MKKMILALLASIFIASPVFAAENRVYIYESDGKIYYDSSRFDGRFMFHEGMTPGGQTYTDYLTIENETSKDYDIYFKIISDNNTPKATNLLEHIEMRVYLDGTEFYNGKARGLDYRGMGVNLSDAVKIGTFGRHSSKQMKVETYLDTAYEDINNPDTSLTRWSFWIVDSEAPEPDPEEPIIPEEVVPNPKTGDEFTPLFMVLLGSSLSLFIFITIRERRETSKRRR